MPGREYMSKTIDCMHLGGKWNCLSAIDRCNRNKNWLWTASFSPHAGPVAKVRHTLHRRNCLSWPSFQNRQPDAETNEADTDLTQILIVSDGKMGHLNQSLGLAEALVDLCPGAGVAQQAPLSRSQAWKSLISGRLPGAVPALVPDLLIGAGHGTHLTLLALKRCWNVPAVVLMKPTLPLALFDLCLIPEHDVPPCRDNVISTRGALNRMRPAPKVPGSGMILIGGPAKNSGWPEAGLLEQLNAVVQRDPRPWKLTTSRRTPGSTLALLQQLEGVELFPVEQTEPGWLPQQLAVTEQCWVSEDSVSMVYEALSAGCAVGTFEVPWQRKGRLFRGLKRLKQNGLLTPFSEWSGTPLRAPEEGFNEAARCAEAIMKKGWL